MEGAEGSPALKLIEAARLYRFFLDMGLLQPHAISAVESMYQLKAQEKQLLSRCVLSRKESEEIMKKIASFEEVEGEIVALDFYNVAITVAEALEGHAVFRCTDGLTRDLASAFGRSRKDLSALHRAAAEMRDVLIRAGPEKVVIVADRQVSHSAEVASDAKGILEGLEVEVVLSSSSDSDLIRLSRSGALVASSDIVIAKSSPRIIDIPVHILIASGLFGKNVIDLSFLTSTTPIAFP